MIVRTKLTTTLDCAPLGTGAEPPIVGISPAKTDTERTHVKTTTARNLFIDVSPLGLKRCQLFYIGRNETTTQDSLQASDPQTNIRLAVDRTLTLRTSQFLMRTASLKSRLNLSHLSASGQAQYRCQKALELKDRGEYDEAQEVMRPLWNRLGERPKVSGLHPSVVAEVLFCVGLLTGWIGSRNEIKESDAWAKDLLTESIRLYELVGDLRNVAEVRTELAVCYWRSGSLDESRIMFSEALENLPALGNARARALLGIAVVEWSASRYKKSLKILRDNAPVFKSITNLALRGFYHNQLALVLRNLAVESNKTDYFQRAIKEYEAADHEFKAAHNTVSRAHVKNNLGFLLYKLSRFHEALEYLDQARHLTASVRDKVRTAQIDETRAQVFIAQRRYAEAESAARGAVRSFEKAGRQCLLAEALVTHGVALARLGKIERARFTFQKAIEVAHQAGALNAAGLAALTLTEEIDDLSPVVLSVAYQQAKEWLTDCQSEDISLRLAEAQKKLPSEVEIASQGAAEILFNKPSRLPDEVLKFERRLISQALAKVDGQVTHAAKLLGIGRQRLAYILETRHQDLLKDRTPIRRRGRKGQ